MKYAKGALNRYYIPLLVLVGGSALITLIPAEGMRRVTVAIDEGDERGLLYAAVFMFSLFLVQVIMDYFSGMLEVYMVEKQSIYLEGMLIDKITRTNKSEMDKIDDGETIIKITNNVRDYIWSFLQMIKEGFRGVVILISTLLYIFYLNWKLALLFISYQFVVVLVNRFYGKRINELTKRVIKMKQENTSIVLDLLNNFCTIKTLRGYGIFGRFIDKETVYTKERVRLIKNRSAHGEFIMMASQLGQVLIILGVGGYLISRGQCSVDVIIAFWSCQFQIMRISSALSTSFVNTKISRQNYNGFKGIFQLEDSKRYTVGRTQDFRELRYRDISFSYGDKRIIDSLNFSIKAGEKIRILGENGRGKSTLLKIIMGLYDPYRGEISFNGESFNNKRLKGLFTYIPQNPTLFTGSIRDNITMGHWNEKKYTELVNGLNLEELQVKFGDEGNFEGFSDGEKQRICIARALYNSNENSIIICDEILSCLDGDNKERVIDMILREYDENTVLMITHEDVGIKFGGEIEINAYQKEVS